MYSLVGLIWPGLLAEGDAAQVGDEYVGHIELRAGSPQHSVTYRAGSYDGLGTAGSGVVEVLFLDVNSKLPVGVDKRARAAESV